jgi:abortive infection bacteriophage resistance protein
MNTSLDTRKQISLLRSRGMIFLDLPKAERYLSNISYYRLKAYWYPYRDLNDPNERFKGQVTFEEVIKHYVFDRRLKLLLFDAIERIEIALRTKLVYHFSMKYGDYFHLNQNNYKSNNSNFRVLLSKSIADINQSKEEFVKHHISKYGNKKLQAWKYFEITTFSRISKHYDNLIDSKLKKQIAKELGVKSIDVLKSWLESFSYTRNIIAHHGRLWNRRFTIKPAIPNQKILLNPFFNKKYKNDKLFYQISCLVYLVNVINPNSSFKNRMISQLNNSNIDLRQMGFPNGWENEPIWK